MPPGRWTLRVGEGQGARTDEVDVRAGEVVRLTPNGLRVVGEER
jgi:hypothetical protein